MVKSSDNILFRFAMGVVRGIAISFTVLLIWMLLFYVTVFDPDAYAAIVLRSEPVKNALLLAAAFVVVFLVCKLGFSVGKKVFYVLSGIYFVTNLLVISILRLLPVYDSYYMVRIASNLLEGNYVEFDKFGYVCLFPYQYGFIKYLEWIYQVAGGVNHDFLPQWLNAVYLWFAILFMVKMSKYLFGRENDTLGLLLMLFLPFQFFVTYVYGSIISFMLSVGSVYFLLRVFKDPSSFLCWGNFAFWLFPWSGIIEKSPG